MAIYIKGRTLPEVWEKSIKRVWEEGDIIATQYDKPEDPPSKDATVMLEITNPLEEPRIHKCFPGGPVELEAYRQEVVDGIHDHWVDPANGKWEYTYHERLNAYEGFKKIPAHEAYYIAIPEKIETYKIDQVKYMIETLKACPHSRRAQAITWKPWEDCGITDPACLQRIWARVINDKLIFNVHMRSNDAFKAAFMNMYAFIDIQKKIADELGVEVGTYTHLIDSYHLYGSYYGEIEGFLKDNRPIEDKTYRSDEEPWSSMTEEAKEIIANSIEEEKKTGRKGL